MRWFAHGAALALSALSSAQAQVTTEATKAISLPLPTLTLPTSLPSLSLPPIIPLPSGARAQPEIVAYGFGGQSSLIDKLPAGVPSALYTMSNKDGSDNIVHAIPLNSQGSNPNGYVNFSAPVAHYRNNGTGLRFGQSGSTLQDALDSQGSLIQAGARLFAVNAGSNSVQAYAINCTNPTQLFPLGGPVTTNGNNPSTIAVGTQKKLFCVATTGTNSGIECFDYNVGFNEPEIRSPQPFTGTTVSLPLPVAQTQNIPQGPADTVSQLLFTDDELYIIAVVKGAVSASTGKVTKPGYIKMYPIGDDGLGKPITSKPAGTQLLFGCTLQYNTYNLFCADSGVGSVLLRPKSSSDLTYSVVVSNPTAKFGNGTNCWGQRSPFQNTSNYISPVDKNYIAAFSADDGSYYATTDFTAGAQTGGSNPQIIELVTASNYVYGLSFGSNSVRSQHILISQDKSLRGSIVSGQNVQLQGVTNAVSGLAVFVPQAGDGDDTCDFS